MQTHRFPPNIIAAILKGGPIPTIGETPTMMAKNPFKNGIAPPVEHPDVWGVPEMGDGGAGRGFNDPQLQPTPAPEAPRWPPPAPPRMQSVLKRKP